MLAASGEAGDKLRDPSCSWKVCVPLNLDGFCTRVPLSGNTELLFPPAVLQQSSLLLGPGKPDQCHLGGAYATSKGVPASYTSAALSWGS